MKRVNHQKKTGFTLIELMIVIAIIGIVLAYAIPAYRNYNLQAFRGECNVMVDGIKTAMTQYKYTKGSWPSQLSDMGINGLSGAHVTVTVSAPAAGGLATCSVDVLGGGSTIEWTASLASGSGNVQWTCNDNTSTNTWNICP